MAKNADHGEGVGQEGEDAHPGTAVGAAEREGLELRASSRAHRERATLCAGVAGASSPGRPLGGVSGVEAVASAVIRPRSLAFGARTPW